MHPISTITKLLHTAHYLCYLAVKEDFSNPFKEWQGPKDKPIYVLGNGPSLKTLLADMEADFAPYSESEFFVVNDFVHDSRFALLRPRYYCLSDFLFFMNTIYSDRGHRVMQGLAEKVDWPMLLFIPWCQRKSSYLLPIGENPNIRIVTFHHPTYWGIELLRHFLLKKGLGNGEFGTVILNAIYVSLMLGYKQIYVYGIEHTFFENLVVNRDNVLCTKVKHFYSEKEEWKPLLEHYPGPMENKPFTMAEFLKDKSILFQGHQIMNRFAKACGASIYNCTLGSMVDAYERKG